MPDINQLKDKRHIWLLTALLLIPINCFATGGPAVAVFFISVPTIFYAFFCLLSVYGLETVRKKSRILFFISVFALNVLLMGILGRMSYQLSVHGPPYPEIYRKVSSVYQTGFLGSALIPIVLWISSKLIDYLRSRSAATQRNLN